MSLRQSILTLLLLATGSLLPVSSQECSDEVGTWDEIGIEKALTKNWDVGLDLEYRAQDKARFSAGLSTSYKLNKYLKLGIGYNFLYSLKPEKYKEKTEGEIGSDEWSIGYNYTPKYWYPRHRFSVEATGSIKLWKWLKISLRERYQLTYSKARTVEKFKYRENHLTHYDYTSSLKYDEDGFPVFALDEDGNLMFDENGNLMFVYDTEVSTEEETTTTNVPETKYYPASTDQVLRSRLKLEYDKKRCPFSPFISAEFHNSVSRGDHMLLQKIRTAAGLTYKFRKHNEISLAYILTFNMYDIEENETEGAGITREVVRLHDRMHAINIGYKYSF